MIIPVAQRVLTVDVAPDETSLTVMVKTSFR